MIELRSNMWRCTACNSVWAVVVIPDKNLSVAETVEAQAREHRCGLSLAPSAHASGVDAGEVGV